MKVTVIDVGGTFIKYACMNENFEILSRGKISTPMEGREKFIETIEKIFKSMSDSKGIAISLPGIIDFEKGYCITSGWLEYNSGFAIVETLEKICSVKISVENDARCAAIAEMTLGSLKNVNDGFVMIFGTGIGSAIIHDKKIFRGHNFSAGEISFLVTDKDGSLIEDNLFGYQCSTRGLCEMYSNDIDGENFFKLVAAGDEFAIDCLNKITRRIAIQISNIQKIIDPEKIAIGGGISAQKIFVDSIREQLNKIYAESQFKLPRVEIVACKFLNDANLIGALKCWLDK